MATLLNASFVSKRFVSTSSPIGKSVSFRQYAHPFVDKNPMLLANIEIVLGCIFAYISWETGLLWTILGRCMAGQEKVIL